jgi:adenylylsulfate kinase
MKATNTQVHNGTVTRARREMLARHRGAIVWFTGLSGSGKSTLAHAVEERLHLAACRTYVLDGDNVRQGLCADLGFADEERTENIRRVGETAKLFVDAGMVVLTAFISPFRTDRARVRALVPDGDFIEVYCRCSLDVCEERDIKGLYRQARMGTIVDFTGISSPYEAPHAPELIIDTAHQSLADSVDEVLALLQPRLSISAGIPPGT